MFEQIDAAVIDNRIQHMFEFIATETGAGYRLVWGHALKTCPGRNLEGSKKSGSHSHFLGDEKNDDVNKASARPGIGNSHDHLARSVTNCLDLDTRYH